jgi:hypothetical protein
MFVYLKNNPIFATAISESLLRVSGRYSSGQRGRTVNPLGNLRRFESCSPHKNPDQLVRVFCFRNFFKQ